MYVVKSTTKQFIKKLIVLFVICVYVRPVVRSI